MSQSGGAQFTPGPWAVNKSDTCLIMVSKSMGMGAEKHIADVQYNEERYANAHLIAAAPAMYEALSELVKYLREEVADEALDTWAPVFKAAMALAQAEGRQGYDQDHDHH